MTAVSVTEIRNALRCPRVFAIGRARGQKVMFPVGGSALGALFHRIVALAARDPAGASLRRLDAGATADEVAAAFAADLLAVLAAELARSPSYASMPAEVDDLADALRELARHVAGACATGASPPADEVARFFAGAEVPLEVELPGGARLSGRIDALHLPPGGAAEVVEYKLTDDSGDDLDRAQVALYRYLLARARDLDAAPVLLRFRPGLSVVRLPPREADDLVERRLLPLVAEMTGWAASPAGAPATARGDLCPACPVRAACAELYPEPLPARDQPPSGAARPRPDPRGEVREGAAEPPPARGPDPHEGAGGESLIAEGTRIRALILDVLRRQGVTLPTARAPVVGARLIQIEVSVARGSVAAIERAAADVVHRLQADHGLSARFSKSGALRVFTVARAEPRVVRLPELLRARADWLRARAGRFVVGETVDGQALEGDLSDPSSCHLLIGGASGSGKSVLLRGIATSLVHYHSPAEIQLTLVDPKRVSFARLAAGLAAHLAGPIAHDADEAIPLLEACIEEMEERYALFEAARVHDIDEYNEIPDGGRLPRRVILVDELQDLVAARSTREAFIDLVQRLGSKARAAGIHLVLSTQRPTRDNVPGGIKANLQGKIALKVTSAVESRVILDEAGAEDLLGAGDLLADLGQGVVRAQAAVDAG